MTTFHGTTFNQYQAIAPYRLYLDLSMDDREYATNYRNPLFITENSFSEDYNNIKTFNTKEETSSYGVISKLENTQGFKTFIDKYNLKEYLNGDFTLFVPINDNIQDLYNIYENQDEIKENEYRPQWFTKGFHTSKTEPSDVLKYHMLDFVLTPVELLDRKYRLQTKLRNQYFTTNNASIVTGTVKGDKNPNKIVQTLKTDNGWIYLIEKPLIPYYY